MDLNEDNTREHIVRPAATPALGFFPASAPSSSLPPLATVHLHTARLSLHHNMSQLRPYYDHDTFDAGYSVIFKPGVGLIDTHTNKPISATLTSSLLQSTGSSNRSANGFRIGGLSDKRFIGDVGLGKTVRSSAAEKNYVYDLELKEYFDPNNMMELLKNLVWSFFKNYCKSILSQPLEIARLVLQVGVFNFDTKRRSVIRQQLDDVSKAESDLPDEDDDEDDDENYFQSAIEFNNISDHKKPTKKLTPTKPKTALVLESRHKIKPISKHTIDIMSSIAAKDGPLALFRGINASFIHQTLSHTIEAWITGFIAPFLGIPDPFFLDLTHLPDPLRSLWLSVLACVLTGMVLLPLDLIKVRLMLTQFTKPQPEQPASPEQRPLEQNTRSIRESIRKYPLNLLLHPPPAIALLTVLYLFSTSIFRKTTPYLLFIRFNIDSYLSPTFFTLVNLFLLIFEFFIKLPVENVLRKEQVRFLLTSKPYDKHNVVTILNPDENLIVDFNSGWIHNDDDVNQPSMWQRIQRFGLFDGWRVGVLNVFAFWGYNILNSDGTSLDEEKL